MEDDRIRKTGDIITRDLYDIMKDYINEDTDLDNRVNKSLLVINQALQQIGG